MSETLCDNNFKGCDCFDGNPLGNFSSEAPDLPAFRSTYFAGLQPLLGMDWGQIACMAFGDSQASQQAADLLAAVAAERCVIGGSSSGGAVSCPPVPPPCGGTPHRLGSRPTPFFTNTPQDATVNCPDGLPFTYTVPAGLFGGLTQLIANTEAQSYAQQLAMTHLICLSDLPNTGQLGTPYTGTIVATGNFVSATSNFWELVIGAVPDGLTLQTGIGGPAISLTGKPTKAGVFNFTVAVTDPAGDFQTKQYTITITATCIMSVAKFSTAQVVTTGNDLGPLAVRNVLPTRIFTCWPNNPNGLATIPAFLYDGSGNLVDSIADGAGILWSGLDIAVYHPPTDKIFAYASGGDAAAFSVSPLAATSFQVVAPYGNFSWCVVVNPRDHLLYYNANSTLTILDVTGGADNRLATLDPGDPNKQFAGLVTFDPNGLLMFVAYIDFSVTPSLGFVNVYDVTAALPVLLHQWPIPGGAGGVILFDAVYVATNNTVVVTGSELDALQNDQRDFIIVLNAATGAILSNTNNPVAMGGIGGYGAFRSPGLNSAASLIYFGTPNVLLVVCSQTGAVLGQLAVPPFNSITQGAYDSGTQTVDVLHGSAFASRYSITNYGPP